MNAYEIIAKKRDGLKLSEKEIHYFIEQYLRGDIKDYQMSAFLMAVYLRGMDDEETYALTKSYIHSGKIIDLSHVPGIKVDKHSTGGVGDKVSIVLAPLVASLGVPVPMISGRGLGHTGGTLDKLESIPGFRVSGSVEFLQKELEDIGVAMLGQTNAIVPADRKIYALRDVTATVDSIPLITASIMSKKIAEGIDALVLDVKFGNGAFMKQRNEAERLARFLIKVGSDFQKKVVAYLTSMEQPLGYKIGNWLEIEECIDCLQGNGPEDLLEITLQLAAEMLVLGEKTDDLETGREMARQALSNGQALQKFVDLVEYQGGNSTVIHSPEKYPKARFRETIKATQSGYVHSMDTRDIGMVGVLLGAGRTHAEEAVDPQAGVVLDKKIGDFVQSGESLLTLHTNKDQVISEAAERLGSAIRISENKPSIPELIAARITPNFD
ncbi:MAG: pyrimidine-nucleoside phosphorylase [Calditrichia bacterium]